MPTGTDVVVLDTVRVTSDASDWLEATTPIDVIKVAPAPFAPVAPVSQELPLALGVAPTLAAAASASAAVRARAASAAA